ncbi:MAG: UDP-3-O-acyl-N-acetylglucosamine deacetylase [Caulobacteraceae bacterium]
MQHTLAGSVRFSGTGIHSGTSVSVAVHPAAAGAGIVFHRTDRRGCDGRIPALAARVCETRLGTTIGNDAGVTVSTIEHLMAAFAGLDIDNATVEIDGPETPIMDGSSEPFVALLDGVGRERQEARRRYIEVLRPIEVEEGGAGVRLTPADGFELALDIAFDSPAIGRQSLDLALDEAAFRRELAPSRTFGFLEDVESLRAAGLARGGSLDNVVVIDRDTVVNPGGLRCVDEFVRHKALDALGDLYLLGAPLVGRFEGNCSGHRLNNALALALLAAGDAWRWTSARQPLAKAV